MSILQAIVLGVLQGLAEFLPISSSAHLALTPWIFGWDTPGLAFDVALHVGTLAAVLWFFRDQWIALIRAARRLVVTRRAQTEEERRVIFLIIATIPGGIGGLLLAEYAETVFRSPALIATTLIIMGVILWAVDRYSRHEVTLAEMRWTHALLFGLAQVFALVPGVSRSGATMTAGRGMRFHRESTAVFAFLMSMPITAVAAVYEVPKALAQGGLGAPIAAGVVASALSGWLAISVLLRYVARHGFGVFAIYRILLGVSVLALVAARS
ncbi:MAG: undecaprenyl-diphosphate phosphatase [Gemmatimonadaceae bacterium]